MHANEMPWRAQGDNTQAGLNRYPEPQPQALVQRMARLYDVPPARVLVGRGSDEAIDLLVRAFCRAGEDQVVITPPTFGFYKVAARIQGAGVIEVPLTGDGFALDLPAVLEACRRAKIVFLCSPNNPTGNLLDEPAMLALCRELADRALVCVDEAYIEFAARASLARRIDEFPNLVVLRTLSKAYALAGARLGTLVAGEDIVSLLRRIIPPYAIPASTVEQVLALTEAPQRAMAADRIRTLLDEREKASRRLAAMRCVVRVHPSDANFLLGAVPRCARGTGGWQRRRPAGARLRQRAGTGRLPAHLDRHPRAERAAARRAGAPVSTERILFIDRDGTIIEEPPDEQVDSLQKLRLLPGVIPALLELQRAGYRLVLVSNQDGLGSTSFPEPAFREPQDFLRALLGSQGIAFDAEFFCPHSPADGCDCRKPRTAC